MIPVEVNLGLSERKSYKRENDSVTFNCRRNKFNRPIHMKVLDGWRLFNQSDNIMQTLI